MVRIPGLDGNKMGKSDADNAIDIDSDIETIRARYRTRGVTDTRKVRATDPGDPYTGCRSVYPIHELITRGERKTRAIAHSCQAGTMGCVACKDRLVESIAAIILPFQEKRRDLATKDAFVREVLHEGAKKARAIIARQPPRCAKPWASESRNATALSVRAPVRGTAPEIDGRENRTAELLCFRAGSLPSGVRDSGSCMRSYAAFLSAPPTNGAVTASIVPGPGSQTVLLSRPACRQPACRVSPLSGRLY